jgi:hypothetical protein
MSTDTFKLDIAGLYTVIAHGQACEGSREVFFGQPGSCRYCGSSDPSQFHAVAHLIPEALGNRWLISRDECDGCNQKFSKYESNLVAALRPILTVSGTGGKGNKVGQTGRTASGSYIRHSKFPDGKRHLTLVSAGTMPNLSTTPFGKVIQLRFPVPGVPFRPRLAYKALVKMGYALLPEEELLHFTKLRDWLSDPDDTFEFSCLETGLALGTIGNAPDIVSAALLKRVDPTHQLPYMIFTMCVGSVCLQIDLMSDDMEDHLDWGLMGQVNLNWAVVLGPDQELRIEYGKFQPMNWSSLESTPQPIEQLILDFNMATLAGRFSAIYRDKWRTPSKS